MGILYRVHLKIRTRQGSGAPRRVLAAVLTLVLGLCGARAVGQAFPIFNGTSNTCVGAFLDSGGEGAQGYSNNENFTYTICPDSPNDAITLTFITFNLSTAGAAPLDQMTIHDGNSTAATTLGTYTGTGLQNITVQASPLNNSGCLTIVFRTNNTGTGIFAASISCYTPCQRPTAAATMSQPDPVKICIGESVSFNGSTSTAAPGFTIATRTWDFGDGTVLTNAAANVSHTYDQAGEFITQLYVVDNNGCASANRVDLPVRVGTEPTFMGTGGDLVGCVGQTLCLDGVVNATTWNELPGSDLGAGVFLPDDVGSCFESEITFTQFAPGQTLTNVNDLLGICVEMEHSFMGDLVINLISPTGQTVTMHQQGGGATFLGVPVDNDATPNVQGTCWNYCWSPTASNGTWVANAGGTLPSGTYASLNPLSGLLGSQLNGIWRLQVCDLWGSDNGFICSWDVDLNPALFPDLTEFTPIYGPACDSTYWTGPHIATTAAGCDNICVTPPTPGSYSYVYTVKDDFGCTFDTTLTVTIVPLPVVNAGADAVTCGTAVPLNAQIISGGQPAGCTYTLHLFDSFGDGWNSGASITVNNNGVSTTYTLADPPGDQSVITIPVGHGQPLTLTYQAGILWNNENRFELRNSAGTVLHNSGTGPSTGVAWSGVVACPPEPFTFTWSPAGGLSNANIANPSATVTSTTEYCVTAVQPSHPACPATDCITITVDNGVDPGTNGTATVCANAAAFALFPLLGGTPDAGGTWAAPGGAAHSGNFVPGSDIPGVYTYSIVGSAACGSTPESATVMVVVSPLASAGSNANLDMCSTAGAQDLFAQLGGTPDAGGTWTGPSAVTGGMIDPATMNAGVYTYTVAGTAPCPDESATVTVSINTPPDAGTDGTITLCTSDAPTSLFAQLGGTPDAGGTWTGPSAVTGGMIDPATMNAGVYTYTVAGTAPCPDESATVTVSINTPPDAGTDGTITLCTSDAPTSLFAQLGGTPDAGGTWTGPSAVTGGMIDPATMNAGVYTYTVAGTAPCPDESATVTVSINTPPDAGTDGTIALCATSPATSLFNVLGGSPDIGGLWSGPSALSNGLFDPTTMTAGVYTYTVTGTAPCSSSSAEVTVNVVSEPNAGSPGSMILCKTDSPISLFNQLGGAPDPGGTWSGPSVVVSGQFDPATMNAGVYTYTINVPPPCVTVYSTVTIDLVTPPNAGTDGSLTLCISSPSTPLLPATGGTPDAGGTWSGPSSVNGGAFDPATMTPGTYTYTVQGTTPCPADAAGVLVTVVTAPNAGSPGVVTVCASDAVFGLFDELNGTPDAGGAWTGPSNVTNGQFDPATMLPGVYTYTISVPLPCVNVSSTVTVSVVQPPNAGVDGSLTLCISSPSTPLLPAIGGTPDAGGTWSGPSSVNGGAFDPATMTPGTYTYTVQGTTPCPADAAGVLVTVVTAPNAGSPGVVTVCASDAVFGLFDELNGTPDAGGAWTGPSNVTNGQLDPATMLPGVYTYTITVPLPCVNVSSTVTVSVVQPPNAGVDGSLTLCISSPSTPLLPAIGGTPDAGGTWSGPSSVNGGDFDPATMTPGTYTYTVQGTTPCPADAAGVLVTVVATPDAGTPGAIALCTTDGPASLFDQLGGTPDAGGSWSGPSTLASGAFDPATMQAGVYTYTITVPPPCVNVSSTVTVTLAQPPNAGADGGLTLCATSTSEALVNGLQGTPDGGGTWNGPSPVIGGVFNPATMTVGVYTYTVLGSAPCPAASANVEVNVVDNPDPGGPGFITLCSTDAAADLFTWIEGTPDAGGTWSGPSAVIGGLFDPATDLAGVYTYTLTVPPPCTSASTTVTVEVITPPNAGVDGAATLCITSGSTPLSPVLQGTPDAGGTWSRPDGTSFSGTFTPGIDPSGDYTYTVAGTAPCPADVAVVTMQVVTDPDPGTDGTLTLCLSNATVDLFAALGGTPDAGGIWSGPSNVPAGQFDPATHDAGVYTYTIEAPPPCSNVSSTVTVAIMAPPDAGSDGVANLCATGAAVDLFNVLQGAPDAGGTWTNSAGSAVPDNFDPATDQADVFTYTVQGNAPCPHDAATVVVNLTDEPNAGSDAILNLCISGDPVDVFPSLGGADMGGHWSGPGGATFNGIFAPGTNTPGAYVYEVSGTAPCPNASATITVAQLTDPDAGADGGTVLCSSNAPVDLFSLLQGTPDPGGLWLNSMYTPVGAQYDPATQPSDTLLYILTVPPPCVSDTARVIVVVVPASDAGEPAITASCASGAPIDLFATLNGTPDDGGAWSGPGGSMDGIFQPGSDAPGTYTYSVQATTPCPDVSATVMVSVEAPPNAGLDGSASLCPEAASIELFSLLGGTPETGGTWNAPGNATSTGTFHPSTDAPGTYTYTVWGTLCPNDAATASVTIHVVPVPNAGPDAITCDLGYSLGASGTWTSGAWSLPPGVSVGDATSPYTTVTAAAGGPYTFVWNTVSDEGCASSDAVTIVFTQPMEGTIATTDAVCHGYCDGTATVIGAGGNGTYSYTWSNNIAGNAATATSLCAGTYTVLVADTNACSVSVPFIIGQPAPLVIDAVVTQPETCPGSCDGTLEVDDPEGFTYAINGITSNAPVFTGLCPGAYVVTMTNADGCIAQYAGIITSPPPVVPSFTYSPDTIFTNNTEVAFLNLSSPNAISFQWSFGAEGSSTAEHPTYTFPGGLGGMYEVCLTAADANGCVQTICTPLPIHDLLMVFVPNAFTPNGDGYNDEFLPIFNLPQVKDYQFMVFNRWGEQIFGTDLPGKPWNGNYGGAMSQVDVYVWKLLCKDALTDEPIERIGHVTIVR